MRSKTAFTIIEVIFVIVLIAILALVAIPRLSLTRDDAKITVALNGLGTLVNDLSTYYTTKDYYSSDLSDMTHLKDVNYSTIWSSVSQSGVLTYYTDDDDGALEACIYLSIRNQEGNLTISNVLTPVGTICKSLQSIDSYKKILGTKLVGGNRIQF